MAHQSWLTDSDLGTYNEETAISGIQIKYEPTTESGCVTSNPILISSSLPTTLYLTEPVNNTVVLSGKLPGVRETTTYYFTLRLTEKDSLGNIVKTNDRYFYITSENIPVTWNPNKITFEAYNDSAFECNLSDSLLNKNGNETFRKVDGTLPAGLTLNDNGLISGYIEEEITEITEYSFGIRVYVNNVEVETCGKQTITITINPGVENTKPFWITNEGNIGNVNKNEGSTLSIVAMDLTSASTTLKYKLADPTDRHLDDTITGLPPGLTLNYNGTITGYTSTTQVKKWYFGAYAYKYIELEDNYIYSDYRKFYITSNEVSPEHTINWLDEDDTYNLGTYTVGEDISGKIPLATVEDGSEINYYLSGDTYPKGLVLSKDGTLSGNLTLQNSGVYTFDIMAKSAYTYIIRKFKVNLKAGLTEYALKMSLRLNLEYRDDYTEIRNQLNPNTGYNEKLSNYNIDTFPTIDIATLKCYDKEVLAAMMNFGNPEVVRFGLTKGLEHTQVDSSGAVTANYEVFYKSIDESTYQWDKINCGDYDFENKLEQLKLTDDIDEDAELEFRNDVYDTYTYGDNVIGTVASKSKLLSLDTFDMKIGSNVKVLYDESDDKNTNYYKLSNNGWMNIGSAIPHELMTTSPRVSYNIFNFLNVRDILSQKVYIYQKTGTYYYDEGNQQLFTVSDITDQKLFFRNGKKYYISNLDGSNQEEVKYESHIVSNSSGHIITNTLFTPITNDAPFIILYDNNNGEIYYLKQIINPWCFDFTRNGSRISIDTIPENAEMVLPYITEYRQKEIDAGITDINKSGIISVEPLIGTNLYYVKFLDIDVEPLPMWKRESAEKWQPKTSYAIGTIILHDTTYYKVKQQFISGETFVYDSNLLEILNGDDVNSLLTKNYFPTLDLGYYETGTNRKYLKDLNNAEYEGKYWYRKDFLFWEAICTPIYKTNIDTFGVPFYSNVNLFESYSRGIKSRTFEIICDVPTANVTIITSPEQYNIKHDGNRWKVEVPSGTHITWSITADGYYPEGGSYIIVSDEKHIISLKKQCILTVYPTPSDATVTLTANGYEQGLWRTITYSPINVTSTSGYIQSGVYYVDLSTPSEIFDDGVKVYNNIYDSNIVRKYYNDIPYRCIFTNDSGLSSYLIDIPGLVTFTVKPTPSDANVVLTASGYSQSGNSITCKVGTTVTYTVSKEGYNTRTGSFILNTNTTTDIVLSEIE